MNTEETLEQMRRLRLSAMARSLEDRISRGEHRNTDPEAFVAFLINDEVESRASKRILTLIKKAKLRPEQACLENIRFSTKRGFGKMDLDRFYREDWINRAENMVFTGATGTGKTYLSEALVFQACRMGFRAQKLSQDMLLEEIRVHRATGKYGKFLKDMDKTRVLVIDDFAIGDHTGAQYCEILHLLEDRVGKGSTIVTSQYPCDKWFERIPDPTIADGICDRLLMTSWVLAMKGPSQRGPLRKGGKGDKK
jgi:DNA replication protein DnaC